MLDDCIEVTKMHGDKSKENYAICDKEVAMSKRMVAWSPLEKNAILLKHRYVSCSKSAPQRSKRFVRYRISRSLNFDTSIRSSSSENSSMEEDKHLSRSAKIMRALNFNSSPSYYGKTKIKKSLNFNATPSPKRFTPVRKNIRKSLSINFNSPLSVSNKYLSFDDSPSDSASSSLLVSSSESIDENQNETPLQQDGKGHEVLHYSTPNAKLTKEALCSASFTPLLRSRLKETIDKIVYVGATPRSQSLKRVKGRSKCPINITVNTSRNLFHEFHDKDDDRPCTPENVIHIVAESMSAIKRSHKKERSSRWSEQVVNNFVSGESEIRFLSAGQDKYVDALEESESNMNRYVDKGSNCEDLSLCHSEDDMSETGSLFDYTEEQERTSDERKKVFDCALNHVSVEPDVKVEYLSEMEKLRENELLEDREDNDTDSLSNRSVGSTNDIRAVTPEPGREVVLDVEKSVTPENRINILQRVANDSIKKSHKKVKDDNKRRLFSPKVLQGKLEAAEVSDIIKLGDFEQSEKEKEEEEEEEEEDARAVEENYVDTSIGERSCTPEKLTSSRLLLSQFSSVKKSHKKDKHNKILCGFLKRQEYFNKDMDLAASNRYDAFECRNNTEHFCGLSLDVEDATFSVACANTDSLFDKLSPSKRKKMPDSSLDYETSGSFDSELQESDTSKEEFQIFTPLKRKRSLLACNDATGYSHLYDLPFEKAEPSEDAAAGSNFSRCLTPVRNFSNSCVKKGENDTAAVIKPDGKVSSESEKEANDCDSTEVTGRSTPRNMSTTELYFHLDSIKKSHKKNKRENVSRKVIGLIRNNRSTDEKDETSFENVEHGTHRSLEVSNDCVVADDSLNKSIDRVRVEENWRNMAADNKGKRGSNSAGTLSVTPPNCLKTKSYMKLLQETSIKRSHKKIREKKKREATIQLSDDGSIFGDEEKLTVTEDGSLRD